MARRNQAHFLSPSDAHYPSANEGDAQQRRPAAYWSFQPQRLPSSRQQQSPLISLAQTPLSHPVDGASSSVDSYGLDHGLLSTVPSAFPVGSPQTQLQLPVDPSLEDPASFQSPSFASSAHSGISDSNPIFRFYSHDSSDPWNPERALGTLGQPPSPFFIDPSKFHPNHAGPNLDILRYRSAPTSEVESHDTAPADSGYGPSTKSVRSEGTVITTSDFPDLSRQFQLIMPSAGGSWASSSTRQGSAALEVRSNSGPGNARTEQAPGYPCDKCDQVLKCPSDLKKHKYKHDKPFVCDVPGCTWARGFTTYNDLTRHKKSKHKINSATKNYKCMSPNCRAKNKIWPRLDNFKQHVKRMHTEDDAEDLIRRSEWTGDLIPSATAKGEAEADEGLDDALAGISDRQDGQRAAESSSQPVPSTGWDVNALELTPSLEFPTNQGLLDSWQTQDRDSRGLGRPGLSAGRAPTATMLPSTEIVGTISSPRQGTLAAGVALCRILSREHSPDAPSRIASGNNNSTSRGSNAIKASGDLAMHEGAESLNSAKGYLVSGNPSLPILDLGKKELEDILMRLLNGATGLPSEQIPSPESASGRGSVDENASPADIESNFHEIGKRLPVARVIKCLAKMQSLLSKRRKGKQGGGSRNKNKKCPRCKLTFNTNSELRKHLNRHERPYGCTYPNCHKLFGSKSDWKRHEHSQHFQHEMWRCRIPHSAGTHSHLLAGVGGVSQTSSEYMFPRADPLAVCGEVFWRREDISAHLSALHGIRAHKVEEEMASIRIGRNGQSRFWCGFCCSLRDLESRRQDAWEERFNHIEVHFRKEKRKITEWWCLEAKKTKDEVRREMNRRTFDDIDDVGNSPDSQLSVEETPEDGTARTGGTPFDSNLGTLQLAHATESADRERHGEEEHMEHPSPPTDLNISPLLGYAAHHAEEAEPTPIDELDPRPAKRPKHTHEDDSYHHHPSALSVTPLPEAHLYVDYTHIADPSMATHHIDHHHSHHDPHQDPNHHQHHHQEQQHHETLPHHPPYQLMEPAVVTPQNWYCGKCHQGPYPFAVYSKCLDCNHTLCSCCRGEYLDGYVD